MCFSSMRCKISEQLSLSYLTSREVRYNCLSHVCWLATEIPGCEWKHGTGMLERFAIDLIVSKTGHKARKHARFHSPSIHLSLTDSNFNQRVLFRVNDIIRQHTPTTFLTYHPGSQPPLSVLHLSPPRLQSAYLVLLFKNQLVSLATSQQTDLPCNTSVFPSSLSMIKTSTGTNRAALTSCFIIVIAI